jgi:hypothetical protein
LYDFACIFFPTAIAKLILDALIDTPNSFLMNAPAQVNNTNVQPNPLRIDQMLNPMSIEEYNELVNIREYEKANKAVRDFSSLPQQEKDRFLVSAKEVLLDHRAETDKLKHFSLGELAGFKRLMNEQSIITPRPMGNLSLTFQMDPFLPGNYNVEFSRTNMILECNTSDKSHVYRNYVAKLNGYNNRNQKPF